MRHVIKRDGPWIAGAKVQIGTPVGVWCDAKPKLEMAYSSVEAAMRNSPRTDAEAPCPMCLEHALMGEASGMRIAKVGGQEIEPVGHPERVATLAAAARLYRLFWGSGNYPCPPNQQDADRCEQALVEKARQAQAELDGFRASRAGRIALDAVMPEWVYVDASDHIKRELWHTFVSDSEDEWVEWLVAHSDMPRERAEVFVAERFKRR